MKILIVCYPGYKSGGGTASYTFAVANGLKVLGHSVFMASTENYSVMQTFIFKKFRSLPVLEWRDWYLKNFLKKVVKNIGKVDLIYCPDYRFSGLGCYGVAKDLDIPLVMHYHDYWFACLHGDLLCGNHQALTGSFEPCVERAAAWKKLWQIYKKAYFNKKNKLIAKAAGHITISQCMADCLRDYEITNQAEVVYTPIDFSFVSGNKKELKDKLSKLKGNDFVVLFVGKLIEHRGVKQILEAAKKLKDKKITFWLVGGGELFKDIERDLTNKIFDKVVLFGNVAYDDIAEYYKIADVFLFPTLLEEPLGRAVVEAMSFGLPIITSNAGGLKEIVSDGIEGLLINPLQFEEIEKAVLRVFENRDLRVQMSQAALKKAEDFKSSKVVGKIAKIFESIIKK